MITSDRLAKVFIDTFGVLVFLLGLPIVGHCSEDSMCSTYYIHCFALAEL